jgi:hypothetical protein
MALRHGGAGRAAAGFQVCSGGTVHSVPSQPLALNGRPLRRPHALVRRFRPGEARGGESAVSGGRHPSRRPPTSRRPRFQALLLHFQPGAHITASKAAQSRILVVVGASVWFGSCWRRIGSPGLVMVRNALDVTRAGGWSWALHRARKVTHGACPSAHRADRRRRAPAVASLSAEAAGFASFYEPRRSRSRLETPRMKQTSPRPRPLVPSADPFHRGAADARSLSASRAAPRPPIGCLPVP